MGVMDDVRVQRQWTYDGRTNFRHVSLHSNERQRREAHTTTQIIHSIFHN